MQEIPSGALFGALFILFLLSAFFSGSETALMSVNRYRMRHKARQGHKGARLAEKLLERPDRLLGLILPVDGAKTLSGLIVEYLEDIPEASASVRIGGVAMIKNNTIRTVRIPPPRIGRERG